ncbi:hypothetical protein CR513_30534, partial [Mucuna pruriens]
MKRSRNEFAIIAIYVDDINIIRTLEELPKIKNCLKKKCEVKDLSNTKYLEVSKDSFRHQGNDGELLGSKVPYLSAIRELIY